MKLTKDKYGSIIDEETGKTLLLTGVAMPCGNADPIAAINTEEMLKRVNQHDALVVMNSELVEALGSVLQYEALDIHSIEEVSNFEGVLVRAKELGL
jgi:hypothetical protein